MHGSGGEAVRLGRLLDEVEVGGNEEGGGRGRQRGYLNLHIYLLWRA